MFKKQAACKIEKDADNIIELKKLTKALEFSKTIRAPVPEIKEFTLDAGTSYMVGLFKNNAIAVTRVYSGAGVEFPSHIHDEWELILVYEGELHLTVEGKTKIIKKKEFYYVEPKVSHSAFYPVDSWVLCVTMPASADFPEGG